MSWIRRRSISTNPAFSSSRSEPETKIGCSGSVSGRFVGACLGFKPPFRRSNPTRGRSCEGLVCTSCHDKPGSKLSTDRGKYFELMNTVAGFDDVIHVFGECTSCHVKKPGSIKLTSTGRQFAKLVDDMEGLKALLEAEHPAPTRSDEPTPDD